MFGARSEACGIARFPCLLFKIFVRIAAGRPIGPMTAVTVTPCLQSFGTSSVCHVVLNSHGRRFSTFTHENISQTV